MIGGLGGIFDGGSDDDSGDSIIDEEKNSPDELLCRCELCKEPDELDLFAADSNDAAIKRSFYAVYFIC